MRTLDLVEAIERCSSALGARGITVREINSADEIREMVSSLGKPYLTPVMSPTNNDFTEKNAFWLVAEEGGEPKMLGGARLDDIGEENLSSYWKRSLSRQYSIENAVGDFSQVVSSQLSGKIAYFGDLFVVSGNSVSRRNRNNLRWFTGIGHALTQLKWQPDWIYAFIREEDVLRGASSSYGFSRVVPFPQVWSDPPAPRSNAEWLAYSTRKEVLHLLAAAKYAATTEVSNSS